MSKTLKTTVAGVTAAAMLAVSSLVAVPTATAASPGAYTYNGGEVILAGHRGHKKWNKKRYSKNYYHRHHRRGSDFPAALFGFAAGAMIGSALAQPSYGYRGGNWDAYCASKYRSYKPWTGTYTTYSGHERPCR